MDMARMNNNRFIPFKETKNEPTDSAQISDSELLKLAIAISSESGKLLESVSNKDFENSKMLVVQLRDKLELAINKLELNKKAPMPNPVGYMAITGTTSIEEFKKVNPSQYPTFIKDLITKASTKPRNSDEYLDREMDDGIVVPPKMWKSITEINLKKPDKQSLVEEMRKLSKEGITVVKSNFHYKTPIHIEDFTEPFKYLENMHDYNGSLLITLLKSEIEINNQADTFQLDLKAEKQSCLNGDKIIIYAYDISGSTSKGEEKKFLIVLNFDKLHGTLNYDYALFMNGKKTSLSHRQVVELEKFCKSKKININI